MYITKINNIYRISIQVEILTFSLYPMDNPAHLMKNTALGQHVDRNKVK